MQDSTHTTFKKRRLPLYSKFAAPFNVASVTARCGAMCLTIRGFNKATFANFSQIEHCSCLDATGDYSWHVEIDI